MTPFLAQTQTTSPVSFSPRPFPTVFGVGGGGNNGRSDNRVVSRTWRDSSLSIRHSSDRVA